MKRSAAMGTAILLALGGLACGGEDAADGQRSADRPQPRAQQQGQQTDVTDEELRAFVGATGRLQEVAERAQSDLQAAEGREETRQVRDDFLETQAEIVQEAGLDKARYSEIRAAIETDPDLQQRFLEIQQEGAQP